MRQLQITQSNSLMFKLAILLGAIGWTVDWSWGFQSTFKQHLRQVGVALTTLNWL